MCSLSREDKDIVLDFYFRCGDEETINRGCDLVACNAEAAVLYARLEETLTQLDSIKYEPCPENLVELTIARLRLAASSGQTQLQRLLELERRRGGEEAEQPEHEEPVLTSAKWSFRENLSKLSSLAAVVLITAGIAWPALTGMRRTAIRIACAGHLKNLGTGLSQYAGENDDYVPFAAAMGASQWSRVGEPGSHTSGPFLLLQLDLAKGKDFICAGHVTAIPLNLLPEELARRRDFVCRDNLSYGWRVLCPTSDRRLSQLRGVIMSDMNPVFQGSCARSSSGPVELSEEQLRSCSTNHRCKGQNVLSTDNSVLFLKVRLVGNDDIFTIFGRTTYYGNELPCDPLDVFVP